MEIKFIVYFEQILQCPSVFIVDFEQVSAGCEGSIKVGHSPSKKNFVICSLKAL